MPNEGTTISEDLVPTRRSLISRLKNWDDHESWSAFFTVYWKIIYCAARRAGLTDAEGQEVVQETVISVSRAIPGFKYDPQTGSFKSWLLQLTSWRIKDQLRARVRVIAEPIRTDSGEDDEALCSNGLAITAEVERIWEQEWESNLLQAAIERVKQRFDPKQFQLFDLIVLQQWPTDKVRSVLNVGAARIYIAKHRVSKAIKNELARIKKEGF